MTDNVVKMAKFHPPIVKAIEGICKMFKVLFTIVTKEYTCPQCGLLHNMYFVTEGKSIITCPVKMVVVFPSEAKVVLGKNTLPIRVQPNGPWGQWWTVAMKDPAVVVPPPPSSDQQEVDTTPVKKVKKARSPIKPKRWTVVMKDPAVIVPVKKVKKSRKSRKPKHE